MRILYYSPHPLLGLNDASGYGVHMREMITAFENLGHDVRPLIAGGITAGEPKSTRNSGNIWKKTTKKLVPRYVWGGLRDLSIIRHDRLMRTKCEHFIREFRPDLIYERAAYLMTSGIDCARRFGIKHVLEMNAPFLEQRIELGGNTPLLPIARRVEKKQLSQTDKVAPISTALKDFYINEYGLNEESFVVAPMAINPSTKIALDCCPEYLLQATKGKLTFGYLGSILPWHGLEILIEAFSSIAHQIPKAVLLIVGDGRSLNELKRTARSRQLDDRIIFHGRVPHESVFSVIAKMDICVIPNSSWYQSSTKLFEYGLMHKPVIIPNVPPLLEIARRDEDALVYNPSAGELAKALLILANDESRREQLAESLYKRIVSKFTWDAIAQSVLNGCQEDH